MKDIVTAVLADFNILYETDIGAALYLYMESSNKEYFEDYLNEIPTYEFFRFKALTRSEKNPIRYLFKNEYKSSADDIYADLLKTKWDKILHYSPITDIFPTFSLLASNFGTIIQVNCKNQAEVDKLRTEVTWESFINIEKTSHYSALYLHDIEEVITLDAVGKTVYIYDYALNFLNNDMVEKAISPLAIPYGSTTEFKIISPFNDFKIPEGYVGGFNNKKGK